jgi:hypothetical protein
MSGNPPNSWLDLPVDLNRSTSLVPTGFSRGQAIILGLTSARASRAPTQVSSGSVLLTPW